MTPFATVASLARAIRPCCVSGLKLREELIADYSQCAFYTAGTIRELCAVLADAQRTGQPHQTCLNPPPADSKLCHPSKPVERHSG
jgi:hypothetical protein